MRTEQNGEITVFLSLTLTCICALMCGLFESARMAGASWYMQMALNSSLDSLMSCYHRDLWEKYHLLLLEYEDEEGLETELMPYLDTYLEAASVYGLNEEALNVLPPITITAKKGQFLEQEIVDYMKLGIFDMEREPEKIKSALEGIKEASSLGNIAGDYQIDTKKALALEKSIDRISESLKRQEEYLESGKQKLKSSDGQGFKSDAEKLKKELQKMPGLISAYQKESEELEKTLGESKILAMREGQNLSDSTAGTVFEALGGWNPYIDAEADRKKTVEDVGLRAADNMKILQSAIQKAKDTQEYIDTWEGDDEDDELDEQELWDEVYNEVNRFYVDRSIAGSGVKDKGKMNVLEHIADMAKGDLLSLVMPEDRMVSAGFLDSTALPSNVVIDTGDQSGGLVDMNLLNQALINEYVAYHFLHFCSNEEREFQYEQEYLLSGQNTDRANLKNTVEKLIWVREAMNLIYLLGDSEKRGEADALALLITGAAGITPLSKLLSFFILTLWAFGESVGDVRALLNGGKIPFMKNYSEWKLSLSQLLEDGLQTKSTDMSKSENGLDYQGYLKALLFLENREVRNFRMMDMIQKNIRIEQNDFLMSQCAYQINIESSAKGRMATLKKKSSKAY